jgi:hypothetical protein
LGDEVWHDAMELLLTGERIDAARVRLTRYNRRMKGCGDGAK